MGNNKGRFDCFLKRHRALLIIKRKAVEMAKRIKEAEFDFLFIICEVL